jgi:hypothetical protein
MYKLLWCTCQVLPVLYLVLPDDPNAFTVSVLDHIFKTRTCLIGEIAQKDLVTAGCECVIMDIVQFINVMYMRIDQLRVVFGCIQFLLQSLHQAIAFFQQVFPGGGFQSHRFADILIANAKKFPDMVFGYIEDGIFIDRRKSGTCSGLCRAPISMP